MCGLITFNNFWNSVQVEMAMMVTYFTGVVLKEIKLSNPTFLDKLSDNKTPCSMYVPIKRPECSVQTDRAVDYIIYGLQMLGTNAWFLRQTSSFHFLSLTISMKDDFACFGLLMRVQNTSVQHV